MSYITFISKNATAGIGINKKDIVIIQSGEKLICRTIPLSKVKALKGRYAIINPIKGKVFCYLTEKELLAIFPGFEKHIPFAESEIVEEENMNTLILKDNIHLVSKTPDPRIQCVTYIYANTKGKKVSVVEHSDRYISVQNDKRREIYSGSSWIVACLAINTELEE